MKIGMISLGCSKNLVDSEKIMGMLTSGGHVLVKDAKQAQIIIVNTCGFIVPAKEEAISTILEMAEYKKGFCQKLIVVGCLAKRYKEQLIASMPEIDAVVGVDEYDRLHEILAELLEGDTLPSWQGCERKTVTPPYTAYLKIADGCSNRCSYCAIPLIRGDYRSFAMEDILQEAAALEKQGVKELVLIAQDTTRYGTDTVQCRILKDLLVKLDAMSFHWIRILYMYPDELDNDLIDTIAQGKHLIPYFDLPLQHGTDKMLQLMNRRGSVASIKQSIAYIRQVIPHAVFRTTMMVGFPFETREDFEELLDFMREIRFDRLGGFPYSKEEDTPGYAMKPQIRKDVKEKRYAQMMAVQESIAKENAQKLLNETLEVLVESVEPLTGKYKGRSIYSAPDQVDGFVLFTSAQSHKPGDFVHVHITKAYTHDLAGEAVDTLV